MSTYIERFDLLRDETFRRRVQIGVWVACGAILDNAGSSNGQKQFAKNALKGETDADTLRRMVLRCGAADVGKDSTDVQVQTVVTAVVAELAGP